MVTDHKKGFLMQSFGLYANPLKDKDFIHTRHIMRILKEKNINFCIDGQLAEEFPEFPRCEVEKPGVMLVLGGDGTMLSAARKYAQAGTLFLGINLGRLGFLLETEYHGVEQAIDAILEGDFSVEERCILETKIRKGDGSEFVTGLALNDAVISRRQVMRLVDVHISINEQYSDNFVGDGVIISTPTGSTGYSLSAGGPVISPTLDLMLITPVCPHRLSSKSMVISAKDRVEIRTSADADGAMLTLDGQMSAELEENDSVLVGTADFKAKFIRFKKRDFYTMFKEKLSEWNSLK